MEALAYFIGWTIVGGLVAFGVGWCIGIIMNIEGFINV